MSFTSVAQSRLETLAGGGILGSFIRELEQRDGLPPLVPSSEDPWRFELSQRISALALPELCGSAVKDEDAAKAVKSGLLLWNDDLETSHTLSQAIHTPLGSYWHGIMHRREPDYSNSKYWFHNVGEHATHGDLKTSAVLAARHLNQEELATTFASSYEWNAIGFIDLCEAAAQGKLDDAALQCLRLIQLEEIRLLLAYSLGKALGTLQVSL